MYTIHLHQLEFFSHHGVYAEETLLGNKFQVSMDVYTDLKDPIGSVQETIDYSVIYSIIQRHMNQARPLLEEVAASITDDVLLISPRITSITITIKKMHAPISQFKGEVGVSFTRHR